MEVGKSVSGFDYEKKRKKKLNAIHLIILKLFL